MDFDPRDYAGVRARDDDLMYGSWLEDPRDRDERDRDVDPGRITRATRLSTGWTCRAGWNENWCTTSGGDCTS